MLEKKWSKERTDLIFIVTKLVAAQEKGRWGAGGGGGGVKKKERRRMRRTKFLVEPINNSSAGYHNLFFKNHHFTMTGNAPVVHMVVTSFLPRVVSSKVACTSREDRLCVLVHGDTFH